MVYYGGTIAQRLLSGSATWGTTAPRANRGAAHDFLAIDELTSELAIGSEEEADAYLKWLWYHTKSQLSFPSNWAAIQALANELLHRPTVGEHRARLIIRGAILEA